MKKKKWTVMFLSINQTEKTFFIQNVGYTEDDFIKLFKLTQEQVEIFNRTYFNGFEKDISDNEFKALLQYCVTNMDVIGVYRINNFYNRDQKVINDMKDNVRTFWIGKGYREVIHCESPIIDTHGGTVFNKRDYLYLIEERIREEEDELKYLEAQINETENEYKDKISQLEKKYELKETNLNKEFETIERTIELNKDKIRKQNWFLDQHPLLEKDYNELKEKFDKLVERYKNGEKICETQLIEAQKNWPQELKNIETEINSKKNELSNIEEELKTKKHELSENQKSLDYTKNLICRYETDLDHILQKYLL